MGFTMRRARLVQGSVVVDETASDELPPTPDDGDGICECMTPDGDVLTAVDGCWQESMGTPVLFGVPGCKNGIDRATASHRLNVRSGRIGAAIERSWAGVDIADFDGLRKRYDMSRDEMSEYIDGYLEVLTALHKAEADPDDFATLFRDWFEHGGSYFDQYLMTHVH